MELTWRGELLAEDFEAENEHHHDEFNAGGVYVYALAFGDSIRAYAGKAEASTGIGWRMTQHVCATFGLLYFVYDEKGDPVLPNDNVAMWGQRLAAFKEPDRFLALAARQAKQMQFFYLPFLHHDSAKAKEAEHLLVQRLRERPGVICENQRLPRGSGTTIILPPPPHGSLLARALGPEPLETAG